MAKSELNDWGRPQYKRADLGELVRGKYAKRISEATNVVVLDPRVSKIFPNDEAVNAALLGLIGADRPHAKIKSKRRTKTPQKKRAA
jgi:hypothetical protein